MIVGDAPKADLSRQRIESSMYLCAIQTIAPVGNEQIGRHWPTSPMTITSLDVVGKHLASRVMQRHEAGLAEFGATDCEHPGGEIHVLNLKIAGFVALTR